MPLESFFFVFILRSPTSESANLYFLQSAWRKIILPYLMDGGNFPPIFNATVYFTRRIDVRIDVLWAIPDIRHVSLNKI